MLNVEAFVQFTSNLSFTTPLRTMLTIRVHIISVTKNYSKCTLINSSGTGKIHEFRVCTLSAVIIRSSAIAERDCATGAKMYKKSHLKRPTKERPSNALFYRFQVIASCLLTGVNLNLPYLHLTLPVRVTLVEFC